MFHKEGGKIILIATTVTVVMLLLIDHFTYLQWLRMTLMLFVLFFLVMILQFFRNPRRLIIPKTNQVIAPVDGKVVVIEEVYEAEYFKDKRLQVSIFMSPINVHVTRYPVTG
ncbi:MAG: phosphatidylserine decarboxylase family protein, partial [Flavobacterium sp.]